MSILLEGGTVVLGTGKTRRHERCDVLLAGDKIAAVGPDLGRTLPAGTRVVDARRRIVIPGLINAHLHSNESFEQGMTDNLPLELWRMRTYPAYGVPPLTEDDYYLRALMAGIQSIRAGVTTVQDDVINLSYTSASVDGACRAYRELGLRAWVTTSLGDKSLVDSHPFLSDILPTDVFATLKDDVPRPAAEQIALFERNRQCWSETADGRIRINLGPRGPQRCTSDLLLRIADAAARYGCAIHTHVLETRAQAVSAQLDYGKSMIAHLKEIGFLGPHLTLNHGIWLSDADIEMLGEHGCSVTHNPLSNLKIGSGICPVRRLLKAGVNVALGTDGLATSDTADMIPALRVAALLHKVGTTDYEEWVSADEAFTMATSAGARSGLRGEETGEIAVGRKADIVLLDADHWGFIPLHDPVAQLAYSATSEAVRTVIIDGAVVMDDRKLLTLDEPAARQAIGDAAERWRRDIKPLHLAAADMLIPVMSSMYAKAIHAFETEDWARSLRR
jgi:5-methylthioadenosine/S-adenosylhomocysteine deaminase